MSDDAELDSEEAARERAEAFRDSVVTWMREHPEQFWPAIAIRLFSGLVKAIDPEAPARCHLLLEWRDLSTVTEQLEINVAPRLQRDGKLMIELWTDHVVSGEARLHHGPLADFDRKPD